MYCRVLACDFDGTCASDGHLAPETADVLRTARAAGIMTLLVTGRVLEDLRRGSVDFSAFDAVVAENGAIVWLPNVDRTIQLGEAPPEWFLGRLRDAGIAFQAGAVVIGTWEQHAAHALSLIREAGVDLQLVFNRGAVMLLPSGINKAVGVERALAELGRSARNMIAFGDAENDLPLFALSEIGVAARGSVPAVATAADDRLTQPGPAGVGHYIRRLLDLHARVPTTDRRRLELGVTSWGTAAALPLGQTNVLVSGDPRSGKSWLAGLVAERMIEEGYRLCILDPEGDYASLATRPGVVPIGRRIALPAPENLAAVLADVGASLIVNLTGLPQPEKCRYVSAAIGALADERARTGLPHWTLVDEAHYFLHAGQECCARLTAHTGNVVLVTYRPSLIAPEVHDTIGAHLLTHTAIDAERYFMETLLAARGPEGFHPADALRDVTMPRAGMLLQTSEGPHWQTFLPGSRLAPHVHHGRKYVDTTFGDERAFRFRFVDGRPSSAHNVREFVAALEAVPIASLRHHLRSGDFSRWARDVLGDPDLATGLEKVERTTALGAEPRREELIAHVRDRYLVS